MSRVETEIGLSRDDLVGMAILNGCDFNPDVSLVEVLMWYIVPFWKCTEILVYIKVS